MTIMTLIDYNDFAVDSHNYELDTHTVTAIARRPSFSPDRSHFHYKWMTDNHINHWIIMSKNEKGRRTRNKSKLPPPPVLLTRPRSLYRWRDGEVWRWKHWDAGRMDGLLRGRWGITLKVSLHPHRKSAGQAADSFSRGWENWRLELLLIWRRHSKSRAVVKTGVLTVNVYRPLSMSIEKLFFMFKPLDSITSYLFQLSVPLMQI